MASTFFQDYNQNTPIVSAWLNAVNAAVYGPLGTPKVAVQSAAAWVRFSVAGGVPTIQQSSNIATVVRLSAGVYQITYASPLVNAANCYGITQAESGFSFPSAETQGSVTVTFTNPANTSTDPVAASVVIFGAD